MHRFLNDTGILYICVKEGLGEKVVVSNNDTSERFYSFWTEDELMGKAGEQFSLLETTRTIIGGTTFLKMFFKKN